MKTKFIKVSTADRVPDKMDDYLTDKGKAVFITATKLWFIDKLRISPNWWIQEIPDYEDEMIDMLDECKIQIEYLQSKFRETGTGNNLISRLETLLTKLKTES